MLEQSGAFLAGNLGDSGQQAAMALLQQKVSIQATTLAFNDITLLLSGLILSVLLFLPFIKKAQPMMK
jgi:DHA2 family multidrug resistance protein